MKQLKTEEIKEIVVKDTTLVEEIATERMKSLFDKTRVPAVIRVDKNYEAVKGFFATFEVGERLVVKNQTLEVAAIVEGGLLLKPVGVWIAADVTENDS